MADWTRIAKLAGMLGSNGDGEVVNAARMIDRALKSEGLSWGDFANRISAGGAFSPGGAARTSAERAQARRSWADQDAWEERMRQEEEKARQQQARRNRGDW